MNGGQGVLFSLIVPTLNRREDVGRLLASIEAQTFRDFEVIVIDQNPGDLLDEIFQDFSARLPLLRVRAEPNGPARARNHGLGFAKGMLVNFPDDDCEFRPELLARVAAHMNEHPEADALFARAVDPISGESSVTKFDTQSQWVTAENLYRTTVEFTMFARRSLFDDVGPLDEKLGVGTYFGAEEGADFVLRALYKNKRLYYDPTLLISHVQKVARYDAKERQRGYNYGKGFGRLSVKHAFLYKKPFAAWRFVNFQLRAAVGALLSLCRLQPARAAYYLSVVRGRFVGVFKSWPEFSIRQVPDEDGTAS